MLSGSSEADGDPRGRVRSFRILPVRNHAPVDQEEGKPREFRLATAACGERMSPAGVLRMLAGTVMAEEPLPDVAVDLCQRQLRAIQPDDEVPTETAEFTHQTTSALHGSTGAPRDPP